MELVVSWNGQTQFLGGDLDLFEKRAFRSRAWTLLESRQMYRRDETSLVAEDRDIYYMRLAKAVGQGANCKGARVGAIIVLKKQLVATDYNGIPEGFTKLRGSRMHSVFR